MYGYKKEKPPSWRNLLFFGMILLVATWAFPLFFPSASPNILAAKTFSAVMWNPPKCTQDYSHIGKNGSNHAWVYMANTDQVLIHTLVSAQSSRLQGTTADIFVLWFGSDCPNPCMVSALDKIGAQIRVVEPPLTAADMTNKVYASIINRLNKWWDFVKLEVFNLVQYKKAVFLDGDTLFIKNLDELFQLPAGTHTDAPKSPFNSGLFVVKPSRTDYEALLDIVKEGRYDLQRSWGGAFKDKKGIYRPRTYAPYYGAESTQGLFYYFFHTVKKSFHLVPRDIYHYQGTESPSGVKLVHFNICAKPVPGVVPKECKRFHRKWQVVYKTLHLDACISTSERDDSIPH
jgi:hypothetical protein